MVLVIAAGAHVARAQPGMTSPTPTGAGPSTTPAAAPPGETAPDRAPASMGFALGVDGHLGIGELIESSLAARAELVVAPHHAIVARVGVGSVQWADSEYDDPIYHEVFARLGYRLSATHIYAGLELGRAMYKAHWDMVDNMPPHDGTWFGETTVTALVGWKLGPIDLGFDYTRSEASSLGVYLGAGYRR